MDTARPLVVEPIDLAVHAAGKQCGGRDGHLNCNSSSRVDSMSISWRGRPIFCSTRSQFSGVQTSNQCTKAPMGRQYPAAERRELSVTYVPAAGLRKRPSHGLGCNSQRPGGALPVAPRRRRPPRRQDDSRGRRRGGAAIAGGPPRRDLLGCPWTLATGRARVSGPGVIRRDSLRSAEGRLPPLRDFARVLAHSFPRRTHGLALLRESAGPWVPVIKRLPSTQLSFLSRYGKARGATLNDVLLAAAYRALASRESGMAPPDFASP